MTPFTWPARPQGAAGQVTGEPVKGDIVSEYKNYDVEINGMQTTLRLNEEQAKARGLVEDKPAAKEPAKKAAPAAANKARTAKNK